MGYANQPPVTIYRYQLPADLLSADGQTLGYPWLESIETIHDRPALSFGGAVWESEGGSAIPIATRNLTSITQRVFGVDARVACSDHRRLASARNRRHDDRRHFDAPSTSDRP